MQLILARYTKPTRLIAALLLASFPAFSWWETGHRTVARLAAAHLTPAARTRIARILNVPDTPDAVADALAAAATWPDEHRTPTTSRWHYINLALEDSKADIRDRCPHQDCVTLRIRIFARQLSARASESSTSDLDALRYLVHFVGDLHQPIHAASDADLGGNCEHVDPPIETATNLHAVWDGAIVNSIGLSDRDLASSLEQKLSSFRKNEVAALAAGNEFDWTWESHELALREIYRKLAIPREPAIFPKNCQAAPAAVSNLVLHIPPSYIEEMQPVVRRQLIRAGVRLAKMLNESL